MKSRAAQGDGGCKRCAGWEAASQTCRSAERKAKASCQEVECLAPSHVGRPRFQVFGRIDQLSFVFSGQLRHLRRVSFPNPCVRTEGPPSLRDTKQGVWRRKVMNVYFVSGVQRSDWDIHPTKKMFFWKPTIFQQQFSTLCLKTMCWKTPDIDEFSVGWNFFLGRTHWRKKLAQSAKENDVRSTYEQNKRPRKSKNRTVQQTSKKRFFWWENRRSWPCHGFACFWIF